MRKRGLPLALCAVLVTLSLNAAEPLSEQLTREGFFAHLGESFRVWGGAGLRQVVTLELIEVEDLNLTERIAQFTVVFRGPDDYPLDKGVYTFDNPRSGRFELLIEPTGQDDGGLIYAIDFSLLR